MAKKIITKVLLCSKEDRNEKQQEKKTAGATGNRREKMYRVLLVEDEEIELETLRDYIDWKKNGISRVFTARNGRRALECLEENMADIVITDIQMPGMSGIELAETIVRRGYPCKIVFLTGYDDFSYIHSAFQVNAVDYLLKPFTIEEVEACLKKVRSELEKSEIADWSRKTAAKQLLETALQEKQEPELLRKNFRGVFGEELEECRFGIIAVYGKTEENICSQIQEKYKGIRYISKTERISILLLAEYLSVKDTAFRIWNDLKKDAPRAVGWCSGAWTIDCLYEKAEKLRNCCVLAFHMDPPELFCADEKETEEEKAGNAADHERLFSTAKGACAENICGRSLQSLYASMEPSYFE